MIVHVDVRTGFRQRVAILLQKLSQRLLSHRKLKGVQLLNKVIFSFHDGNYVKRTEAVEQKRQNEDLQRPCAMG